MSLQDARDAAAMLTEDGQAITLTHTAEGTYNPATGAAALTVTTQATFGVEFSFSVGLRNQPGTLIAAGDKQIFMSVNDAAGTALNPAPSVNDKATLENGVTYTILSIDTISRAGIPILHDCHVRAS